MNGKNREKIFFCYAGEDRVFTEEFIEKYLHIYFKGNERDVLWVYRKSIRKGEKWRKEIADAINSAAVAVCILSPAFYRADFIQDTEQPLLIKAAENKQLKILAIHLNECQKFFEDELEAYQTLNKPERPVESIEGEAKKKRELDRLAKMVHSLYKQRIQQGGKQEPGPTDETPATKKVTATEQCDWLWDIKECKGLPPGLEELGKDLRSTKKKKEKTTETPSRIHFIENRDPYACQSVAHIAETISSHRRIVVLAGPQLSGKSMLAESVVERLATGASGVCFELICLQDIDRAFERLQETGNMDINNVKYFVYAIWAKQVVSEYYIKSLTRAERRQARTDKKCNDLFRYMDSIEWVAMDLELKRKRFAQTGAAADFLALEDSILSVLGSLVKDPNFVLAIEAEDIHDYAKVRKDAPHVGEAIVKQFWDTVDDLSEEGEENLDPIGRGTVRFVITTRPRRPYLDDNGPHLPVVEIEPFPEEDCLRYANELGLREIFSESELPRLVREAHEWTNGYAWFLARFMRAVAFLRTNRPERAVESLVETISACSLFWYHNDPCGTDFPAIGAGYRLRRNSIFRTKAQRSKFLDNIVETFKCAPQLVEDFKHVLTSPKTYSRDSTRTSLTTLVQLGLVRHDANSRTFIFSNRIIERHFNPEKIALALSSLTGRRQKKDNEGE